MSEGYVYCFSNESMPGLLKIGMTERTPDIRLQEANSSNTWIALPFKIEFAKKVINAKDKERTIHAILEQYTERINPKREFFKVSKEEVKKIFELMDGNWWAETKLTEKETESETEEEDIDEEIISSSMLERTARKKPKGCRDMSKCFTHGQRVRHTIGINNIWISTYDADKNKLIYEGKEYKAMCSFANAHWKSVKPDSNRHADGWGGCECETSDGWISTYSLPPL